MKVKKLEPYKKDLEKTVSKSFDDNYDDEIKRLEKELE